MKVAIALLPLSLACGDGGKSATPGGRVAKGRCGVPGDSTIARAVTEFVKGVTPTPQRFLATVASDSAIPDAARAALQDRGPTYLYPPDSVNRAKIRQKLMSVGDYTALAVVYRGMSQPDATHATIRIGGHFVDVGKGTPPSAAADLEFACDSTTSWRFVRRIPATGT